MATSSTPELNFDSLEPAPLKDYPEVLRSALNQLNPMPRSFAAASVPRTFSVLQGTGFDENGLEVSR